MIEVENFSDFLQLGATGPVLRAISVVLPDRRVMRYVVEGEGFVAMDAWNDQALARGADGTFTVTISGQGAYTYHANGRLAGVSDLAGNTVRYEWAGVSANPSWQMLTTITDPAGRVISGRFDPLDAGPKPKRFAYTLADWSGRTFTYTYDFSSAPLLASFTDADGHTTRYTYGISSSTTPMPPPRPPVPIP